MEVETTLTHLMTVLDRVEARINDISRELAELVAQNDTRKKLVDAGRRSAIARREKYGHAGPMKKLPDLEVVPAPSPIATDLLGESIPPCIRSKQRRALVGTSPGSLVWHAYAMAYQERYGTDPVRNAKINAQCTQVAKAVGASDGCELVAYYLTRNDAFYVRASHPLGLFVIDIQKLRTERFNGNVVTMTDARRIESGSATDRAIADYARQQQRRDAEVIK